MLFFLNSINLSLYPVVQHDVFALQNDRTHFEHES